MANTSCWLTAGRLESSARPEPLERWLHSGHRKAPVLAAVNWRERGNHAGEHRGTPSGCNHRFARFIRPKNHDEAGRGPNESLLCLSNVSARKRSWVGRNSLQKVRSAAKHKLPRGHSIRRLTKDSHWSKNTFAHLTRYRRRLRKALIIVLLFVAGACALFGYLLNPRPVLPKLSSTADKFAAASPHHT
jgi:hypothetical protein